MANIVSVFTLTPQHRQQLACTLWERTNKVAKSCRDSSRRRGRRLDLFNQTTVVVTRWRHLRRRGPPALSRGWNNSGLPWPAVTAPQRPPVRRRPSHVALAAACPSDRVYCYRPDPGRVAAAGVRSGRDQCELSADMFRAFPSTHNSCRRRRLHGAVSQRSDGDECIETLCLLRPQLPRATPNRICLLRRITSNSQFKYVTVFKINNQILKFYLLNNKLGIQEAQLSQRGRAMLLVIEYFAKSQKVTEGH